MAGRSAQRIDLGKRGFDQAWRARQHHYGVTFGGMMGIRRSGHSRATDPYSDPCDVGDGRGDGEGRSVSVVGLACRYPDADDPASLLGVITSGRRAFRRIPPCRINLADYYSADLATPDATYSTRAAVLEGWRFDRSAFGISDATYLRADPAQCLARAVAPPALAPSA